MSRQTWGDSVSDPQTVFVPAYAKINLTLAVLGKRPDGYHELASVMQTIALHDTLRIEVTTDGEITCTTDVSELQTPDNLAYRAALLLRAEGAISDLGARIELRKAVPAQAGLGGGSSDAASVLLALDRLWRLQIPRQRLEELAAQLGSDVPFFISGGTALVEGRGEVVTPLADAEPLWQILVKPPISVPTVTAFRALTPADYGTEEETQALVEAIQRGDSLPFQSLTNSLERSVFATYPELREAAEALHAAGAPVVRMSGSGPTLYAPFRGLAAATEVREAMRGSPYQTWLCHSVNRDLMQAAITGSHVGLPGK
jgi:4-diphosphocytidyl-2-C-methyl-D-erythritol kinase